MPHPAFAAAALAALFVATVATAQEGANPGSGSVTGTLDTDPARWIVIGHADGDGSTWHEDGGRDVVRLVAAPQDAPGNTSGPGALTLAFTAQSGATEPEIVEAQITYRGDGRDFVASGENVDLSLTALAAQGGDIAVTGSFVATLTPGGATGLIITAEAGQVIDGNFQATVPRVGGSE